MLHASTGFAAEAADSSSLEEIVVTAQKRSENIRDVPISIGIVQAINLKLLVSRVTKAWSMK